MPPLTSPTASQSSPWRTAISSSTAYTASSNERPLAVPRSASCATASAFSFSARARSSSSRSPWIVWFSSCRRALCWSEDLLDDRERRALEGGERVVLRVGGELLAQVVADAHRRLGEHRLDLVLHRHGGLVAEVLREHAGDVARVGPERLVELPVEDLGDRAGAVGELALDLARGLLQLGLDELDVRARLLAVQHARADLERVGDHRRRVVARLDAGAQVSTAVGSSIASPSTSTRLARTVMRGARSGVAAASMGGTSVRSAPGRNRTEDACLRVRRATAERSSPAPSCSSSSSSSE